MEHLLWASPVLGSGTQQCPQQTSSCPQELTANGGPQIMNREQFKYSKSDDKCYLQKKKKGREGEGVEVQKEGQVVTQG